MRIIEPPAKPHQRRAKQSKKPKVLIIAIVIGLVGSSIWYLHGRRQNNQDNQSAQVSSASSEEAIHKVAGVQSGPVRFFTGEQFQKLYEILAMPNTTAIVTPPTITGNDQADLRIRQVAESRGYKLRSVPVMPIVKTNEPGLSEDDLLQPKAYDGWLQLKKQAKNDGIPLKLNSGYRSIDWQRRFFVAKLQASGVSLSQIASGQADDAILNVLHMVAPPGYSRHHTGYTIDLICDDGSGRAFEHTNCFSWMNADNYAKAKQAGWIPSYPDGVSNQGPEPEPWEYVWVGNENLTN